MFLLPGSFGYLQRSRPPLLPAPYLCRFSAPSPHCPPNPRHTSAAGRHLSLSGACPFAPVAPGGSCVKSRVGALKASWHSLVHMEWLPPLLHGLGGCVSSPQREEGRYFCIASGGAGEAGQAHDCLPLPWFRVRPFCFLVLSSFGPTVQELLDLVVHRYRVHTQVAD